MGLWEFLAIAAIASTIGKVITSFSDRRALPPADATAAQDVDALRSAVSDLGTRLHRLEEERDFYKDLLEASPGARSLRAPEGE